MTSMEHAIEKAARIIHGCTGDEDGAPVAARALAADGLLAPAPLREEWRVFSPARGMESLEPSMTAALDEVDGQLELTDMDPAAFGTERDWRVERRMASPWLPVDGVDRGEGDGRAVL